MKRFLIILAALLAVASSCNHRGLPTFPSICPQCPAGTFPFPSRTTCACVPCTQTYACPVGSVWNPTLCRCTCTPIACPANFFQSPLNGCACICNIAVCLNGQPVNPATCTCPP